MSSHLMSKKLTSLSYVKATAKLLHFFELYKFFIILFANSPFYAKIFCNG